MNSADGSKPTAATPRLANLSDGIFAIAMTVMALELTARVSQVEDPGELWADVWPQALSFVISFHVLGLMWLAQRAMLGGIVRGGRAHTVAFLGFLMFAALIPFPAAILGTHPGQSWAVIVYGGFLTAALICLDVSVRFARQADAGREYGVHRRVALGVLSYGVCTGLALWNGYAGLAAFIVAHVIFTARPIVESQRSVSVRANPD